MSSSAAIIPCYNNSATVGRAIRSALEQTRPPSEVFVIDDGSTDGSRELVASEFGDAVIQVRTDRAGGAGARNAGIERATTEFVAILDADDWWYPEHVHVATSLLDREGDVAFMGWLDDHDVEGARLDRPGPPITESRAGLAPGDYLRVRETLRTRHSSVIYRRAPLVDAGMFDVSFPRRHDIELWLRMITRGGWSFDPGPAGGYQVGTPGSISRNIAERELFCLRAFLRHEASLPSELVVPIIARHARQAMASALTDGNAEDRKKANEEAYPRLSPRDKVLLGLGRMAPGAFAALNRWRRRGA